MGRGEVGCAGGGRGGGGSGGRADRPLVICGPGTLSLPWTHLSSREVEVEEEVAAAAAAGAPGQKMVYNDSHFLALSSLAKAARTVCQRWDGMGG